MEIEKLDLGNTLYVGIKSLRSKINSLKNVIDQIDVAPGHFWDIRFNSNLRKDISCNIDDDLLRHALKTQISRYTMKLSRLEEEFKNL